jgi:hypothetical protein
MTARLEDLKPDAQVRGLVGHEAVRISTAQMMGEAAQILFRDKEAELETLSGGRKWRLRTLTNDKGCPDQSTPRWIKTHA